MTDRMKEVNEKYYIEINAISNALKDLENGRIKELTGANIDGYLSTNIRTLRKQLNELFSKVVNESESDLDKLNDMFK